jgi:hypothetical protein
VALQVRVSVSVALHCRCVRKLKVEGDSDDNW